MFDRFIKKANKWQVWLAFILLCGLGLRLWCLNQSGIFFYDEAMYLGHSLVGLEFLKMNHAAAAANPWEAFLFYLRFPLNFTKPIWILIVDSRFFLSDIYNWDYAKYASCVFGMLTLWLTFVFARRFFGSAVIALLAAAILAFLPGHVFYSRIGLQEALSTFLVLAGFYFYVFSRGFSLKIFLAGIFFAMAYLSNYRLIVLPVLILMTECWLGLMSREGFRIRHFIWTCVTFFTVMVMVGGLMDGLQLKYTFSWIFHQMDMSLYPHKNMHVGPRLWTEILAYPYYLFRLENGLLALSFFGCLYFIVIRQWRMAFFFVIACTQMGLFFFSSDRGARYIAIVLPFVAIASAVLIHTAYQTVRPVYQKFVIIFVAVMFLGLITRTFGLISDVSAYRPAVDFLTARDANVKFLSSQKIVQELYMQDRTKVDEAPQDFNEFCSFYLKGYRYLVLDPQIYISFPSKDYKWTLPLDGYLSFVDRYARPVMVFPHFNRAVMERVVFEHSDSLFDSINFLNSPDLDKMSSLRIYDMNEFLPAMIDLVNRKTHK